MVFTEDLFGECEALRILVESVDGRGWQRPTIFHGWTIYDEIAHNHYLDRLAMLAINDPGAFADVGEEVMRLSRADPDYSFRRYTNAKLGILPREVVLRQWVSTYTDLCALIGTRDPAEKMPWFGPPMTMEACASARQMETWAHGQDIFDMLRIRRRNEDRIRNIALLGVKTFGWSFANRKIEVPAIRPYVALTGPSGIQWTWNDPASSESVVGSAEDFCLIVTHRRHVEDTRLEVRGESANAWLRIAQCFAGDPVDGPAVGARVVQYSDGTSL